MLNFYAANILERLGRPLSPYCPKVKAENSNSMGQTGTPCLCTRKANPCPERSRFNARQKMRQGRFATTKDSVYLLNSGASPARHGGESHLSRSCWIGNADVKQLPD
jgi:hypothetical protein